MYIKSTLVLSITILAFAMNLHDSVWIIISVTSIVASITTIVLESKPQENIIG